MSQSTNEKACVRGPLRFISDWDQSLQGYAFPVGCIVMFTLVIYKTWKQMRTGMRNVSQLSLLILGLVELVLFTSFVPQMLIPHRGFYADAWFRRFYFDYVIPHTGVANVLSVFDSFLTAFICYEFLLFTKNEKTKEIISSVRRQIVVYVAIFLFALAIGAVSFFTYTNKSTYKCGDRFEYHPVPNFSLKVLEYISLMQSIFAIFLPSVLVAYTTHRISQSVAYNTLPTEANELISTSSPNASGTVSQLKRNLVLLSIAFVVPHVLSFAPYLYIFNRSYARVLLSMVGSCTTLVLLSKIVCYYLLQRISFLLAKIGVVHVY